MAIGEVDVKDVEMVVVEMNVSVYMWDEEVAVEEWKNMVAVDEV